MPNLLTTRPLRTSKGLRSINDNYCVSNVVGLKDSVIVSDKMEGLNPPPVTDQKNSKLTLNVDSHVANAHIVTGLPQRKGVNPNICQLYTEIKYVKDVSCVGHLPSVKLVTNAQHAVLFYVFLFFWGGEIYFYLM